MPDRCAVHSTFTLERTYDASPQRVFAAWSDPAAKGRWFGATATEHTLDFRPGGLEITRGRTPDGTEMTFASTYHDIVQDHRIVYGSTMAADDTIITVSLTTVQLLAGDGGGTRLVLVEQGTFLDGQEKPEWREHGTGEWLDKLGPELDS